MRQCFQQPRDRCWLPQPKKNLKIGVCETFLANVCVHFCVLNISVSMSMCLCRICVCVFYVSVSSICLCLLVKHFFSIFCLFGCPTRLSSRDQRNIAQLCATVCYGASDHPAEESAQEAAHSTLGNIDIIYLYWYWCNTSILIQYININIDVH